MFIEQPCYYFFRDNLLIIKSSKEFCYELARSDEDIFSKYPCQRLLIPAVSWLYVNLPSSRSVMATIRSTHKENFAKAGNTL